jgi:nicotinate phosphoribosyltransferase
LTPDERQWLQETCPYFTQEYLDYLASYRFKPEQVKVTFTPVSEDGLSGRLDLEATGPWVETILWEVPLMASLSECYFTTQMTDWSYDGQEDLAYEKARMMLEAGCFFSELGTRRRRTFHGHDMVLKSLTQAAHDFSRDSANPLPGRFGGTSNVYLARKYGMTPVGTIAHEWFMGVAALKGYEKANCKALDLWEEVYGDQHLIALTDTFTTKAFFQDFSLDPARAARWTGLRQDSGDPFAFAPRAKEMYESLGIDPREKRYVFSDGLNVDKVLRLQKQTTELGLDRVAFGIGTSLTNDYKLASSGGKEKSKALNMVIKLQTVEDKPCIKISDDVTKTKGDPATLELVKKLYNLTF